MRRGLKIGLLLATPPVVGVLLVWACVAALGLIAAFVGEHRLFGLPVTRVMFWEDVAAWVPLSIATGWALTLVSPRHGMRLALGTALCGVAWLSYGLWDMVVMYGEGDAMGFLVPILAKAAAYLSAGLIGGALLDRWRHRHGTPRP